MDEQELLEMQAKVNELYEWMMIRKEQQLAFPLDETSQTIINNL